MKNLLKKTHIDRKNIPEEKRKILIHLTDLKNAYSYVYYTALVDHFLKKEDQNGLIVDWGGYVGQMTILLNLLGYNCENYLLEYLEKIEVKNHCIKLLKILLQFGHED